MSSRVIKVDTTVVDFFPVVSKSDNITRMTGETQDKFSVKIIRDGTLQSILFTIIEVGSTGVYEFSFHPASQGIWYVEVTDSQDRIHGAEYVCGVATLNDICLTLSDVWKIETGRWKIDTASKQMTFYDSDGLTPLYTFNLYDSLGSPNVDSVFERRR
jgi:hypothetical protein